MGSLEGRRVFWVRIKELRSLLDSGKSLLLYFWVFQPPLLQSQGGVVAMGTAGCCGLWGTVLWGRMLGEGGTRSRVSGQRLGGPWGSV